MKARGKAAQEIQQGQADNNLQHFHPRPQPQPPLVQSQPPMPQPQIQQQPPLPQYGYPGEYPPPHGYHHPMHQYPPQPQYPQPAYGEYLPPRPQPPYDQYLPQHPPYGYHQHPHLHQFQPAYAQYPHGHQPPYLPYNQPNPSVPYQQAPDQSGCIFHMPPEDNDEAQTNSFFAKPFPQDYRPHPEYNMLANTNNVASTIANNTTGNNHPEKKLEPMVTQFNDFKISNNAEEIAAKEKSSTTEPQERQWPALYIQLESVEGLNRGYAFLKTKAVNQEAAEAAKSAMDIAITVMVARKTLTKFIINDPRPPVEHILTAVKTEKTLENANSELCALIKSIDTKEELKAFKFLQRLIAKASKLYQKLDKLSGTKNSELNTKLAAVQEMRITLYAEWEQFKLKPSYAPCLKKTPTKK